jgi:hypothetical protein
MASCGEDGASAARGAGRRVKAQGKPAFPNRCAALRDLNRRLAGRGNSVLRAQTHRLQPQIHPELDSVFLFLNARALDATNNRLSCNIVTSYKSCSSTSPTPLLFPSGLNSKHPLNSQLGLLCDPAYAGMLSMANMRACCSLTCAVHCWDKVGCRACGTYFDDLLQNVIFRMKQYSGLRLRDTS